jgi:CBS domain-containing protein
MALVGLLTLGGGGILLLLIAFFIYAGASEEERAVKVQVTLGGLRVRDLMTPHPVTLRPEQTLEEAFRTMVVTKHVGFPVVDAAGNVAGFLGLQELGQVDRAQYAITTVGAAMRKEPAMIPPDALATDALRRMTGSGDEHLVVAEFGKLAGLLSKTDVSRVVRILAVEQGAEPGELGV